MDIVALKNLIYEKSALGYSYLIVKLACNSADKVREYLSHE